VAAFNHALEILKVKLAGRDLLGMTLEDCKFALKEEAE